ncbi:hypothetical protein [Sinomonas gamaensis]|uniref:hypothetical protein n=1 Tax=Sinomonas gamaensis TaxID=2565624 RepID=UPI001107AF53|nr:hypothetical protein [Sinomonas gamaensis]
MSDLRTLPLPLPRPEEKTLRDQLRGILADALEGPRLPEESKDRLRRLIAAHPDRPELAFIEHLRSLRTPAEEDRRLLAG